MELSSKRDRLFQMVTASGPWLVQCAGERRWIERREECRFCSAKGELWVQSFFLHWFISILQALPASRFPLPASQLNQDQTLSSTVPSDFDVKPSGLTIRPMSSLPLHKKPPLSQSPLLPVLFELKTGDSSAPLLRQSFRRSEQSAVSRPRPPFSRTDVPFSHHLLAIPSSSSEHPHAPTREPNAPSLNPAYRVHVAR